MENQEKTNPIEKINEYLSEKKFDQAVKIAEKKNFIDKQIESYDGMNEYWGNVPTKAGNYMNKVGLFKKAKEYYESSGDTDTLEYKNIENIVSISPEEFKENSEIIVEKGDYIEEFPFTSELIFYFKEGDEKTIHDLKKGVSLKEKVQKDYSNYSGRN
jgi:tetratricopeptide (TPR) repeat protein